MSGLSKRFVVAAEGMVGTPFRLHGREPGYGLDCVGLVSIALLQAGRPHQVSSGYRLRNSDIRAFIPVIEDAGFARSHDPLEAGDLVVARPGPGQLHLLVTTSARTFIHAHAGLGRVVETPAPLDWPLLGSWRLIPD